MITPALLILGSGSLVATALVRLARAVDRARVILQASAPGAEKSDDVQVPLDQSLARYAQRAVAAERAVTVFFAGIGVFVLDCLSIALDRYTGDRLTWLPVSLTIAGMFAMLAGAGFMLQESRLAGLQIRDEIQLRTHRSI